MSFRRYEILLPKRYNDGAAVELEKFLVTNNELALQFGAVSFSPEDLHGIWTHGGRRYEEDNVRLCLWTSKTRLKTRRSFNNSK